MVNCLFFDWKGVVKKSTVTENVFISDNSRCTDGRGGSYSLSILVFKRSVF
jgi:hypothetical protein